MRYLPFLVQADGTIAARAGQAPPTFRTSAEMMAAAGLDFEIQKAPMTTTAVTSSMPAPPRRQRAATYCAPVAPTASSMHPNTSRFWNTVMFSPMVAASAVGVPSGSTRTMFTQPGTSRVDTPALFAAMPSDFKVGGFDSHRVFIRAANAHDGSASLRISAETYRMACMNGLHRVSNIGAITLRHTSRADLRNLPVETLFDMASNAALQVQATGARMLEADLSEADFATIVRELFPLEDGISRRARNNVVRAREAVYQALYSPTNDGIRDTAWGGHQAVVEYADWGTPASTVELRANRQLNGTHNALKDRALQAFERMAMAS